MSFDDCSMECSFCGDNIENCTCDAEGGKVICSECKTVLGKDDCHSELMEWGSTVVYCCPGPKCRNSYRMSL